MIVDQVSETLQIIRSLARQGRVVFSSHAEEEARRSGIALEDVVFALARATKCGWQPKAQTWKVKGKDRFDVTMVIIVDIQDDLVVVTVFD